MGFCSMSVPQLSQVSMIEIGGIKQGIAITGNVENPALLILHGGGLPLPGVASRQNYPLLAERYLLIFWDQRGVGTSSDKELPLRELRLQRYLDDIEELTEYVKKEFNKSKIFLLGHSWGSMLGLAAVADHPEDYFAYIGVSQQIDVNASDRQVYTILDQVEDGEKPSSVTKKLRQIGRPPYESVADWLLLRELVARSGGLVSGKGEVGMLGMLSRMMGSFMWNRDFPWFEVFRFQKKMNSTLASVYPDMLAYDQTSLDLIEIPVALFHGQYDLNALPAIAEAWLSNLMAPDKQFVEFSDSAHMPMWEEPEKFQQQVIDFFSAYH